MDSAQDSYRKWGIVLIVFLLILIPAEVAFISQSKKNNSISIKTQERIQPNYPTLYFVELEYDPKTEIAAKKQAGSIKGDKGQLVEATPSSSSDKFNYKVEAVSSSGELLLSGWSSPSKSIISTSDGKYRFKTFIPYASGEIVTIYSSENKILWSGKII